MDFGRHLLRSSNPTHKAGSGKACYPGLRPVWFRIHALNHGSPIVGLSPVRQCHWHTGEPRTGPSTPCVPPQFSVDVKGSSLHLLVVLLSSFRMLLAFIATRMHCWLILNVLSGGTISFNAGFSFPDGPSMHGDLELVTPRYSTWHLPLMNFKRLLSDHFFSLPRIPWCFGVLFLFKSVACFNLFSKLFVFFPSLPANSQGTTGNHPPAEGSEGWSQPFKRCSSDSFQSTSLTTYLGHPSSVCQWGCYRTVCQKNNSIICSSLIHHESGFLIEGYQVSQAPFCSHELMLTTLKNKKKESSALTVLWISTRQELWGQL